MGGLRTAKREGRARRSVVMGGLSPAILLESSFGVSSFTWWLKMRVSCALLLTVLLLVPFVDAKKKKANDWDELESLIENIDDQADDEDPLEKDRINVKKHQEKNPCEEHMCGWGKECVVDKKGEPTCECISKCPELDNDPMDQVCSNTNETFPSLCELYRERCLCKRKSSECENKKHAKVHLEYLGACKQLDECTDELMAQFPARMADWLFQVMRELKKRRELHKLEWEELIAEAENDDEKRHVYPVIWKFCDLDVKPHDKHVSHHELIPITAPVIPMESCIKPFLEGCDADNDGTISIKEWGKCLGLKEGEIQERC
uniref:EF-hand domain-containing protein n=1 Tax=Steinernema glaseri TaxID=37863 RepID=A0A1I7YYF7_9BILA